MKITIACRDNDCQTCRNPRCEHGCHKTWAVDDIARQQLVELRPAEKWGYVA